MSRALPILLLLTTACSVKSGDGLAGSELRDLDDFDAIDNATNVPVRVEVGPAQAVEVDCDENLLPFIETAVEDGTLELALPAGVTLMPTVSCEVIVTVPTLRRVLSSDIGGVDVSGEVWELSYVRNTGLGDVAVTGIDVASLRAVNRQGGGLFLAGLADWADLDNLGSGGIDAGELVCEDADVTNAGSGEVTVTVTGTVVVHVSAEGDVVLLGEPEEVQTQDDGCGDVEQGG